MNRKALAETAIGMTSRALAERWDIKVVFRGTDCKTDGKRIILPAIRDDADTDFIDAVWGHMDHEAAHCVETDFECEGLKEVVKKPVLKHLVNALEDPRIEDRWIKRYPGARRSLSFSSDWMLKKIEAENWEEVSPYGKFVQCSIVNAISGFSGELHWFIKNNADDDTKAKMHQYEKYWRRAMDAESTGEVVEIAKEMMDELEQDEDLQPEGQSLELQLEADGEMLTLAEKLQEEAQKQLDENTYAAYTTEGDSLHVVKESTTVDPHFRNRARLTAGGMRSRLSRVLLAQKATKLSRGHNRGILDSRRFVQAVISDSKRNFKRRVIAPDFNTAVCFMVDHSYSMQGSRLNLAAQTVLVLGEVMNQLRIPFSVYGFSTGNPQIGEERYAAASDVDKESYVRWGDLWVAQYKTWLQSWQATQGAIYSMRHQGQMNTFDGESLRWGAQQLLYRPEPRKILMWLNDGEPCPNVHGMMPKQEAYAKKAAEQVERVVEVVALGIQTDAVKRFYKNYAVVNNLEDLTKTALGKIEAVLKKGIR